MIKAVKMMLREKTLLDVYYSNGTVKRFDTLSLKNKYPQFKALKDRSLFEKAKLMGWSTIYWDDLLDIDTELIYEEGIDVSDEYDDIEAAVIGNMIKEKRLEQNLTQEQLAEKVGIDQSDLSKLEKGLLNPSIKMLNRIAKGLNSNLSISLV